MADLCILNFGFISFEFVIRDVDVIYFVIYNKSGYIEILKYIFSIMRSISIFVYHIKYEKKNLVFRHNVVQINS